jgi:hypothetical protein
MTDASLWTILQMFALELTFFLAFAAAVSLIISSPAHRKLHRPFAAVGAITFGLSALAFLFIHPQIHALVIAAGAFMLYSAAWLADRSTGEETSETP